MIVLATCLMFLIGVHGYSGDDELSEVLNEYITWTTTGEFSSGRTLFSDEIDLSFVGDHEKLMAVPFQEYRLKIERAAKTVARSMTIKSFTIQRSEATAVITDFVHEDAVLIVHRLILVKEDNTWKIQSIQLASEGHQTE